MNRLPVSANSTANLSWKESILTVLTKDNLTFIFLNTVSLGVYGHNQILLQQKEIEELDLQRKSVEAKAESIFKEFDQVKRTIQSLENQSTQHASINIPFTVDQVKTKTQELKSRIVTPDPTNPAPLVATELALICLSYLGSVLVNILTIGIYNIYFYEQNKRRIQQSNITLNELQNRLSQKQRDLAEKIDDQCALLIKNHQTFEEIKRNPAATTLLNFQAEQDRVNLLSEKIEGISREIERLQKEVGECEVRNRDVSELTKCRLKDLQDEIAGIQKVAEKGPLTLKISKLLEKIKTLSQKNQSKKEKVEGHLENARLGLTQTEQIYSRLGFHMASHVLGEGEIAGDAGLNFENEGSVQETSYVHLYKGKRTALQFLSAIFQDSFQELLNLSIKNQKINFNKSAETFYHPENTLALYKFMVLKFALHGRLEENGCSGYKLKLNVDGVSIRPSNPETVLELKNQTLGFQDLRQISTNIDEFTPPEDIGAPFYDPVSLKRCLVQLSHEEKFHLENLILEALIEESHPSMQETRKFLALKDNARVELVKKTNGLIIDLSVAIEKKFGSLGLSSLLNDLADDYESEGFKKKEVLAQEEVLTVEPVVQWTPHYECLSGEFASVIKATKDTYQKLYSGLTKEAVNKEGKQCFTSKESVKEQYFTSHPYWSNHGCLMSACAYLFSTEGRIEESRARNIKESIAAYLQNSDVEKRFEHQIQTVHGKSVEGYRRAMTSGGLIASNFGDLEISLMAEVMGIKIGVLVEGNEQSLTVNEYGLTVPKDEYWYFGPNTKEVLYLYRTTCGTSLTYQPLWPKIQDTSKLKNDEARQAYQKIQPIASKARY